MLARLHKGVSHAHLVKLFSYFEDPNFVYIVLELCRCAFAQFCQKLNIKQSFHICLTRTPNQEEKLDGAAQETKSDHGA